MKRRIISGTLAAALAVSAFGMAAAAQGPLNSHNCVGHFTSGFSPGAQGFTAKANAKSGPGGMAAYIVWLRTTCPTS